MSFRWPDIGALAFCACLVWPFSAAGLELTWVGASTTEMENPHDIKLTPDGRYLLVSDVGNGRVLMLDPQSLDKLGEFGAGEQSGTHDIDFDAEGRVYVADTHNNRVLIYTLNDTEAMLVGQLDEGIRGPEGVLAHPHGRIYVAGAWSHNVIAYENGVDVLELKGVRSPHDLELAANGDIWLADSGNSRLLLLSPDFEVKRKLTREDYDFNGVRYLDLTADGMIIAADKNNHVVKFIDAGGRLVATLGDGRPGLGPNRFTTPEGVEIHGTTLWLADSGNDRIVKYRMVP